MKLYTYYRSSAAYRVRIALNLKGVDYQSEHINLLKGGHLAAKYTLINSQGLVPTLEIDTGVNLTQSSAIIQWLEEVYPDPPLLPGGSLENARIRSFCSAIACDIHPICNLRVIKYVESELGAGKNGKLRWIQHWISKGFSALESEVSGNQFCFGSSPTLSEIYLIPQVYNAIRFQIDMNIYPKLYSIYRNCNELPEFINASPENQIDALG